MEWHRDKSRGFYDAMFRGVLRLGELALLFMVSSPVMAMIQQPTATKALVFERVTVIDVEHGNRLPEQRVVIVGNRIVVMGKMGNVSVPKGARIIDAKGKYLIPGLWDMHTHSRRYTDFFYPLFIANGITGIRDAWSEVPLDTLLLWRREILADTRVGPPRQLLAGPALDEDKSCPKNRGTGHICVSDSADARHMVDSLKAAGADFIKTYRLGKEMYFVVAAEARRMGLPFGGHLPGPTAMDASDSGASFIDHIDNTGGLDTLCLEDKASAERCRSVAERFKRNGTWWVPTWIRPSYGGYGKELRSQRVILRFMKDADAFWTGAVLNPYSHASTDHDSAQSAVTSGAPSKSNADSLGYMYIVRHVGLPTLAGTDVGAPVMKRIPPGFSLHAELALYVAEGMTPLEALQTATLNPAKMLHGMDSLGTVAPGKLADLILLDADPLADINNVTTIRAVVANGRYFDRTALDQLLAQVQAKAKQEPQPLGQTR
jgi:hypothetical protein